MANLQVWHVDCGSNCLCQMVGKQPVVAKLPPEEVTDEQDGCGRGRACHVSLVGGRRERYSMASWLAVPLESSDAAFRERHREYAAGGALGVIGKESDLHK